ncbi:lamin L3 isoform X2 [Lampris incognitus]|uniref:lamin L3 isoform X2 n=1 Tax=Lampris incognitus TaxID=2546036 RepID=UPI0024B5D1CF|nr:lamin L3 isoform X2 [Lampris incognitus]
MASATSTPDTSTSRATRSASRRVAASPGPSPASGISPNRLSRMQEKDELRHLNDRLANYIQRVQELENERSSMLLLLEDKEEAKSREMGNVRRLYDVELADLRKSLDDLANERARLQIDYGSLIEDHKKLQTRNQKKEADLAHALAQWRNTEATLTSKEAEYTKVLSQNRNLSSDMLDLQTQLENMEAVLSETKTQLSSEMLRRVDMENRMQTLKEQLDLQKSISDQEMQEIRSRHESRLVEVDSGRRREFESKLADAMQQLRKEHDSQIQQYKEELEKTFSTKLENAQQAVLEKNDVASATKDELTTTKLRMESLSSQLLRYQKEKGVLEGRVQELERTLDREREVWHQKLHQKEQELLTMRSQMFSQLEDYESLLDVKLALDMEINAYRKMLEVEEKRLHLSPSPSERKTVSWTHEHSARRTRGKKRKYEGPCGSSPAYKMSTHSSTQGAVSVAELDVDGSFVILKNNSEEDQPLGGWVVRRTYPEMSDISFEIPPTYVLPAGQTLTIWAAGVEVEVNPRDFILQGHRSWGPVTDMRVVLLNPDQEEMAERRVVCMQGRSDLETELEFDEECVAGSDIQHFRRQDLSKEASCAVM